RRGPRVSARPLAGARRGPRAPLLRLHRPLRRPPQYGEVRSGPDPYVLEPVRASRRRPDLSGPHRLVPFLRRPRRVTNMDDKRTTRFIGKVTFRYQPRDYVRAHTAIRRKYPAMTVPAFPRVRAVRAAGIPSGPRVPALPSTPATGSHSRRNSAAGTRSAQSPPSSAAAAPRPS